MTQDSHQEEKRDQLTNSDKNTAGATSDEHNREKIWPSGSDAEEGTCEAADGSDKPATGEGAANWFEYGDCGTWKTYDVVPGEEYEIRSYTDHSLLTDASYVIEEPIEETPGPIPGDWDVQKEVDEPLGSGDENWTTYTPVTGTIRIRNIDGGSGIGFYVEVFGPTGIPEGPDTPSELSELLDQKQSLISDIRTNTATYAHRAAVDKEPERFVKETRTELESGSLTINEEKQHTEALKRLVGSEEVVKEASGKPVDDIVSRTGNAVANAAISLGVEVLTLGLGSSSISQRAVKLIGEQVSGGSKATLRTFTGRFGQYATEFDNLISRSSTDFGKAVDNYVDSNPRKFRQNAGLTESQQSTLENALKQDSLKTLTNLARVAANSTPDDLLDEINSLVSDFKEEFNDLAFKYYWYGGQVADYSFEFPKVDLPEKFEFTVDIPVIESRFFDDDFTITYRFDQEQVSNVEELINGFVARLNDLAPYADLIEETTQQSGIEPGLTDSVSLLEDEIANESLGQQDASDREKIVDLGSTGTNALTNATNTVFNSIKPVLDGILLLTTVIGLAILAIYVFIALTTLSSVVAAPAIVPETGLLLTLLGTLSAIDVFLTLSHVAAIGKSLSLITQISSLSTAAITTDVISEVN